MEIVRKIINGKKETTIKDEWGASATSAEVIINDGVGEGNSACHFLLKIEGGQVEFNSSSNQSGGSLEMWGEWEREDFIKLLKQIVIELELVDTKI